MWRVNYDGGERRLETLQDHTPLQRKKPHPLNLLLAFIFQFPATLHFVV